MNRFGFYLTLLVLFLGLAAIGIGAAAFSPASQAQAAQLRALTPGMVVAQALQNLETMQTLAFWQGVRTWAFATFSYPLEALGNIAIFTGVISIAACGGWVCLHLVDHYQRVTTFTIQPLEHGDLKMVLIKFRLGKGKEALEGIRLVNLDTASNQDFLTPQADSLPQVDLVTTYLLGKANLRQEKERGRQGVRIIQ